MVKFGLYFFNRTTLIVTSQYVSKSFRSFHSFRTLHSSPSPSSYPQSLHLLCNLNPEWSEHYVPYNNLKKYIRDMNTAIKTIESKDEKTPEGKTFQEALQEGVEKTEKFYTSQLKHSLANFDFLSGEASNRSLERKKKDEAKSKLIQFSIELNLLQSFATLNYTAISKILKKHDKNFPTSAMKSQFMESFVNNKPMYGTQDELTKLLAQAKNLYADCFEDGNREAAEDILKDALKQELRGRERRGPEGILNKNCFIIDMDGVIYHGDRLLPGVPEFINWLQKENKKYLFLTNGSTRTPEEIQSKLKRLGLEVPASSFHTSAISTAMFLHSQKPNGRAFVIGDNGLLQALKDVNYNILDDTSLDVVPDYVVVGETRNYNFELLERAINYVYKGAKLIGTNVDPVDNATNGYTLACGALVAPIQEATGKKAYFVGKPNALIFRTALAKLDCHSNEAVMIGDRLDTDVQGGMEAGMDTILVLSGIAKLEDLAKFAFKPTYILKGVFEFENILNVNQ